MRIGNKNLVPKAVKVILLALFFPLAIFSQKDKKGVRFEHGLNWLDILETAKRENKYIFLDLYATWCIPCKQMDRSVYPDETLGAFLNKSFISVKVQVDSSTTDNEEIRNWYPQALKIKNEFKISSYPSFLFFSPEGKLIGKEIGYKDASAFKRLAADIIKSQSSLFYDRLERYKKGIKDYPNLAPLAFFVKNVLSDDSLSREIAQDYIEHMDSTQLFIYNNVMLAYDVIGNRSLANNLAREYKKRSLDSIGENQWLTKDNLLFAGRFINLFSSSDKVFKIFLTRPREVDAIMRTNGWTSFRRDLIIVREELEGKLWKNEQPVMQTPNWSSLKAGIQNKYSRVDASKLLLDYQIRYYRRTKNWLQWAQYQDVKISSLVAEKGLQLGDDFWQLNLPAWDAFMHSNEERVLQSALRWSTLSIQLKLFRANPNTQCLDTRANLLYKLGKIQEAISQEQKAIELSNMLAQRQGKEKGPFIDDFVRAMASMKHCEPTYVSDGAVWTSRSLEKLTRCKASTNF